MSPDHDARSAVVAGERAKPNAPQPAEPLDRAPAPGGDAQRRTSGGVFRRRAVVIVVAAAAVLAVGAAGAEWWLNARNYESTDDAFIDARPSAVSPGVAGAIVDVPATDNEIVDAGAPLATIDDRDYQAARAQAEAAVSVAEAAIAANKAQTTAQQATVNQMSLLTKQAEAALAFSRDQSERSQSLLKDGSGTLQQAQLDESDLRQKQAAFDASEAALTQAQKQLLVLAAQQTGAQAQLAQARAQLATAEANLSRVTLVAPFKGRVTELTAAKGAWAAPGQTLMLIVPVDVWVTANFRETQLADIRPGDPATISVDAYGRSFAGHIDSVQAGSGTAFSLLPAENATGNYVKVVQRVPVKIVFDKPPDLELGPGMSVVPTVKVR